MELEDAFLATASLRVLPSTARWALLRLSGMRVQTRSIREACYFGSSEVTIGRGTRVNRGCVFDAHQPIRIGERCNIGMEVMFVTSTHAIADHDRRAGRSESEPIEIGNGCWIGARATILPGVTIGDGAVIAAGAVVASDCEEDTLYAGVPARAMRKL